jgi:hypothetical protein
MFLADRYLQRLLAAASILRLMTLVWCWFDRALQIPRREIGLMVSINGMCNTRKQNGGASRMAQKNQLLGLAPHLS